jgi:hypothetical protein
MTTGNRNVTRIDRFQDDEGKIRIWIRDAAQVYQIAYSDLDLWLRERCPWIGKKLRRAQERIGPFGQPRRYLVESEVKAIREAMDRECKVAPAPAADQDVLPLAKIEKLCGAKRGFLLYAHRHPERCPGGLRVWAKKLPGFDEAGKKRKKLWHGRLSQARELLLATGNSKRPNLQPYTDPLGQVWDPPILARRLHGVPKQRLLDAVKRKHPALGRKIRFLGPEDVPAELRANRQRRYYLREDCRRIGEWLRRTLKKDRAKAIVDEAVRSGPIDCRIVIAKAAAEEIGQKTLDTARRACGIKSTRVGIRGGVTYWHRRNQRLPAAAPVDIPHPKLDEAIQFLGSIPDRESLAWPEVVRRADLKGVARTTLNRAVQCLPRGVQGEPAPTTARPGPLTQAGSTPRDPMLSAGGEATIAGVTGTTEHPDYPGHQKRPYTRGRHHSDEREVVLKACYDLYYVQHRPASEIQERAAGDYGPQYSPRDKRDVKRFACEWSRRFDPPLPLNRDEARSRFLRGNR